MRAFIVLFLFVIIQQEPLKTVMDLEYYLPYEAEQWYYANYKKGIKSELWILCDIYERPDVASRKIGTLQTYYDPGWENYVLLFQDDEDKHTTEQGIVDDWGYGIHLNVIDSANGFARIPDTYLGQTAWLATKTVESPTGNFLAGTVTPYQNQLVSLPRLEAKKVSDGQTALIGRRVYLIEKLANGMLTVREEVPTDMPCGLEEPTKVDMESLERYEFPLEKLVKKNGEINIDLA